MCFHSLRIEADDLKPCHAGSSRQGHIALTYISESEMSYTIRNTTQSFSVPLTFLKDLAQINLDSLDCLALCLVD